MNYQQINLIRLLNFKTEFYQTFNQKIWNPEDSKFFKNIFKKEFLILKKTKKEIFILDLYLFIF